MAKRTTKARVHRRGEKRVHDGNCGVVPPEKAGGLSLIGQDKGVEDRVL